MIKITPFLYLYVDQNIKDMSNVSEIWKSCFNYEEYFEVSNLGRIRNKVSGRILKPTPCKKGYLTTRLFISKDNFKSHKVHRLVMNTFSEIKNQPQVNHINGIKNDNRLENLEWSDNSRNIKHAWATGLFKPKLKKGIECGRSKYFIHKEYGIYKNINELSLEFNITRQKVRNHKLFNLKYIEV
jgi:hypothetical protein